jgi:hypothetical protein
LALTLAVALALTLVRGTGPTASGSRLTVPLPAGSLVTGSRITGSRITGSRAGSAASVDVG